MPHETGQLLDQAAESTLIELACRGCCDSFGVLVRAYQERLYNFLLRRCGNVHHAEEAAQATFVRAWEKLDQFDPRWRFSTWLYTIAIRVTADIERRGRMAGRLIRLSAAPTVQECDPAEDASRRDQWHSVWDLADRLLGPDDRAALWLRYGEDAPIDQIAEVLGRTNGAVRVLLHRARTRLADAWMERNTTDDEDQTRGKGTVATNAATPS